MRLHAAVPCPDPRCPGLLDRHGFCSLCRRQSWEVTQALEVPGRRRARGGADEAARIGGNFTHACGELVPGWQPPGQLRSGARCNRCGGTTVHQVSPARERAGGVIAMSLGHRGPTLIGVLEQYVCMGCGRTEWSLREPTASLGQLPGAEEQPGPCGACGHGTLWTLPLTDRFGSGGSREAGRMPHVAAGETGGPLPVAFAEGAAPTALPGGAHRGVGRLLAQVCPHCLHVHWLAEGVAELVEVADAVPVVEPCGACNDPVRWRVPARERSHVLEVVDRAVAYDARTGSGRGRLFMVVCPGCGLAEWYADRLSELHPDELAGVHRWTGQVTQGPYR